MLRRGRCVPNLRAGAGVGCFSLIASAERGVGRSAAINGKAACSIEWAGSNRPDWHTDKGGGERVCVRRLKSTTRATI